MQRLGAASANAQESWLERLRRNLRRHWVDWRFAVRHVICHGVLLISITLTLGE